MGYSRWNSDDWKSYSSSTSHKSTSDIFTSKKLSKTFDPKGVLFRESRDSNLNPNSTAIIIAADVTGSMGIIADYLSRTGLGVLVEEILARKPVSDPHIMIMGVGDAYYDSAPLQASQFEADNSIVKQLEELYIEKGGGGNNFESYNLPWYFAAFHTSIDCFEKRGKKGYLFTIGDEEAPPTLTKEQIKDIIGDDVPHDLDSKTLLDIVSKKYHIFHVVIEEGRHAKYYLTDVVNSWKALLGQKTLQLSDYSKLSEVIVSAIQVNEGAITKDVVNSWSGGTSVVVKKAINGLTTNTEKNGIVKF